MPALYAVQIEAQLFGSQMIVRVVKQNPHKHHVWCLPLTHSLWEKLGPAAGRYVVNRYAASRHTTRHLLPSHSLAAAVQCALRQVETAFCLPSPN